MGSRQEVVAWIRMAMGWPEQEMFLVMNLNAQNHLLGMSKVAVGDAASVCISARMVFRDAVRSFASSVILVHNHPSGDPTPSDLDVLLTHRMVRVGRLLEIPVLDHIVLGSQHRSCSLVDLGYMNPPPK